MFIRIFLSILGLAILGPIAYGLAMAAIIYAIVSGSIWAIIGSLLLVVALVAGAIVGIVNALAWIMNFEVETDDE